MNIHHVLSRITNGDYDFFCNMTEEELKEVAPFVILLWLRGAHENRWAHVMLTDALVNSKLFTLYRHPKLLFMLCCYANSGMDDTRYSFKKDMKESADKNMKLVMREFSCNESAAKIYERFLTAEDFKELEVKFKEVDHD